jgi:hypothetical protein
MPICRTCNLGIPSSFEATVVLVMRGSRRYTVTLIPEHSDKARRQLDEMLSTLELPPL